ncbi:hypothetical protein Tco_0755656 [Tanacetum coccineum]
MILDHKSRERLLTWYRKKKWEMRMNEGLGVLFIVDIAPSDDDLEIAEAQLLPTSVSPTILSPDYSTDSEPVEEDPEEDIEEKPFEEEEFLALADSSPARLYIDLPSEVEEDDVPSTPPSPTSSHHIISLSQTGLRRVQMSVRPQTPYHLPLMHWLIAGFAALSHRFEIGESSAAAAARQPGTVGHDASYGMTWKTLMKMMTENYCPRSEIKKLETELWKLTVKGTNVESFL